MERPILEKIATAFVLYAILCTSAFGWTEIYSNSCNDPKQTGMRLMTGFKIVPKEGMDGSGALKITRAFPISEDHYCCLMLPVIPAGTKCKVSFFVKGEKLSYDGHPAVEADFKYLSYSAIEYTDVETGKNLGGVGEWCKNPVQNEFREMTYYFRVSAGKNPFLVFRLQRKWGGSLLFDNIRVYADYPEKKAASTEPKILMAGDSTMEDYPPEKAPQTGWGTLLKKFCKESVTVRNFGVSGASTKSCRESGTWKALLDETATGDFVIIQFGHNDHKPNDKYYSDAVKAYPENLRLFIREVKDKGANPVLVTSIPRRTFLPDGVPDDWDPEGGYGLRYYSAAAMVVAAQENVPVVNMNLLMTLTLQKMGDAGSRNLYNHLAKGVSKNYPDGRADDTHLNASGAELCAKIFVDEAKRRKLPVAALLK